MTDPIKFQPYGPESKLVKYVAEDDAAIPFLFNSTFFSPYVFDNPNGVARDTFSYVQSNRYVNAFKFPCGLTLQTNVPEEERNVVPVGGAALAQRCDVRVRSNVVVNPSRQLAEKYGAELGLQRLMANVGPPTNILFYIPEGPLRAYFGPYASLESSVLVGTYKDASHALHYVLSLGQNSEWASQELVDGILQERRADLSTNPEFVSIVYASQYHPFFFIDIPGSVLVRNEVPRGKFFIGGQPSAGVMFPDLGYTAITSMSSLHRGQWFYDVDTSTSGTDTLVINFIGREFIFSIFSDSEVGLLPYSRGAYSSGSSYTAIVNRGVIRPEGTFVFDSNNGGVVVVNGIAQFAGRISMSFVPSGLANPHWFMLSVGFGFFWLGLDGNDYTLTDTRVMINPSNPDEVSVYGFMGLSGVIGRNETQNLVYSSLDVISGATPGHGILGVHAYYTNKQQDIPDLSESNTTSQFTFTKTSGQEFRLHVTDAGIQMEVFDTSATLFDGLIPPLSGYPAIPMAFTFNMQPLPVKHAARGEVVDIGSVTHSAYGVSSATAQIQFNAAKEFSLAPIPLSHLINSNGGELRGAAYNPQTGLLFQAAYGNFSSVAGGIVEHKITLNGVTLVDGTPANLWPADYELAHESVSWLPPNTQQEVFWTNGVFNPEVGHHFEIHQYVDPNRVFISGTPAYYPFFNDVFGSGYPVGYSELPGELLGAEIAVGRYSLLFGEPPYISPYVRWFLLHWENLGGVGVHGLVVFELVAHSRTTDMDGNRHAVTRYLVVMELTLDSYPAWSNNWKAAAYTYADSQFSAFVASMTKQIADIDLQIANSDMDGMLGGTNISVVSRLATLYATMLAQYRALRVVRYNNFASDELMDFMPRGASFVLPGPKVVVQ